MLRLMCSGVSRSPPSTGPHQITISSGATTTRTPRRAIAAQKDNGAQVSTSQGHAKLGSVGALGPCGVPTLLCPRTDSDFLSGVAELVCFVTIRAGQQEKTAFAQIL